MHKIATVGVIATLGIGGAAIAAEGPSHSFVEAGFGLTDLQVPGENVGADGFVIGGSLELPKSFVVNLGYSSRSYDNAIGIDQANISLGVGYICSASDSVDLTTGISFENLKVSPDGGGSDSESGFGLSLGARSQVTDKLELNSVVKYSSIDVGGTRISGFDVSAGGRYYFTPNFAGGLDVVADRFIGAISQVTFVASVRYSFGKLF